MSDQDPCPHLPELVTQLGDAADAAASRHRAECAQCQGELALLRQGFAALGDDPLGRDELAEQRIAARVLPRIFAELAPAPEVALAAAAPSAPPSSRRPELQRLVLFGALTTLAVVPAALYWTRLGAAPLQLARAIGLALLPVGLLPAVLGSSSLRRAALGFAIVLVTALMLSTVDNFDLTVLRGAACLLLAASGSLLPALVVLRAATKEHAGVLSGALLGAAIGSGGAAIQRLMCGLGDLSHALVFHLGPFFFLIALAGLVGSRIARTLPALEPSPLR